MSFLRFYVLYLIPNKNYIYRFNLALSEILYHHLLISFSVYVELLSFSLTK